MSNEKTHVLQLIPASGHWPGRACYCHPEDIEIAAPCGHRVVVVTHQPVTRRLREQVRRDVNRYFQPGQCAPEWP